MYAVSFLKAGSPPELGPVVVLTGDERHLKRGAFDRVALMVLGDSDDRLGLTRFVGDDVDFKTVSDELLTVSMWGDRRLVAIDDADRFVSASRSQLEKYAQKPARKSVLVLDVKTWPKTTRLAKLVAKVGLEIDCARLAGADLVRWLVDSATTEHAKTLRRDAAGLIVELAGDDLGLLEQELAKLSAYVGDRKTIEADDVRTLVGGWRTETTWAIAAAVRRGDAGEALELFGKLVDAGESPHRIFGGLTFVFRRIAQAVQLVQEGANLDAALRQAGVFPREIAESAAYLRRLGRAEARRIESRLLITDANLKGGLIMDERTILEQLLIELTGVPSKQRA